MEQAVRFQLFEDWPYWDNSQLCPWQCMDTHGEMSPASFGMSKML